MPEGFIGQSRRRVEDARFLTGQGRYVADVHTPGALHAWVLRSPHAHAEITSLDASAARAMPGVRLVLTGADLAAEGLGNLPCPAAVATTGPLVVPPRPALPVDRVRFVGEPVALVVAGTPEQARDAAEAIAVDYAPLPAVADPLAALQPGAPLLWPEAAQNQAFLFEKGDRTAVQAAFAAAALAVELDLLNQRVHAWPMEPRCALARWDAAAGYDLMLSSQALHGIRRQLAGSVLGIPDEQVRMHAPDVGGGFGLKNFLFPEYVALLSAAKCLGAPVRWVGEPAEEVLGAVHGRAVQGRARLALDAEGRFLALHAELVADLGAYASPNGPACPTNSLSTALGSIYAIPAILLEVRGAFTNTTPVDAYRGAGKPEANYITERLVAEAARLRGEDPVALRARNLVREFPRRTALGQVLDCGAFTENLAAGETLADRAGFAQRKAASESRGKLRGLGLACFMETARGAPGEYCALAFTAAGDVTISLGTQSNGQGHETSFPQMAADQLGLPPERFRLVQADTGVIPYGNGHGGARSLHMGGSALALAAEALLDKARKLAAHLLQTRPEALRFEAGRFETEGRSLTLDELAKAAEDPANLPEGMAPGLSAAAQTDNALITFPSGCQVAEVEVDAETGEVALLRYQAADDYGRLVNPMLTIGQVQGGLAQGIGQALMEHVAYAPDGQPLAGSLMDYALPRATHLPDLDVRLTELPTGSNPFGVKGSGQAGCIAAPQVVMLAVLDALAPLGVTQLQMPATPLAVWQAIRAVRG